MRNNWKLLLLSIALLNILGGCQEQFPGFEKADNGVYYKLHYRGADTTDRPQITDWVTINMDYRLEDTLLFTSKGLGEPLRFPMIQPMFEGDLYAGLSLMGVGDSMTFAIVADSFFFKTAFDKQLPPNVKPGSPMYYDVKLLELLSQDEHQLEVQREGDRKLKEEFDLLYNYLKDNKIKTEPTASGLYYISLEKGKGRKPVAGEMCSVFLTVKQLDGKELFSNFGGNPLEIEFGKEFDTRGLMEGLGLMHEGEKAFLIVPSEIGVGPGGKDGVPPFTTITYELKLDKIKSIEEVKRDRAERKMLKEQQDQQRKDAEQGRIDAYLRGNNIKLSPLESGLYFIETKAGEGRFPVDGDKVKVHYVLHTIEGKLLQSSYQHRQTFDFELGTGAVIQGWEEAVRLMKKGSKATIIVPSKLAYGSKDRSKEIPAYSPLVFDLELLEIE
ncbi:MAG: FKBP-type peptidyl-prolyl cis-trans isomerase [Bacteroidales bacterium]|nr:FKBP-type peptidyl-prolyl cis-trans isomerase [Bacteroidales bacterium]